MPQPKVSIIVPSYNRAEFLAATLDSIRAQTFKDWELIFIDDGSTDNTEAIVKDYSKQDYRIKYFKQENSERAVARTHGMRLAIADLICLVDSDDLWYPEKLEKQIAVMENDPELVFCYASVNRIDMQGKPVKAAARQHQGASGFIFFDLLERNFIPSVTPMFRKWAFEKVGGQETSFIPYEDWDFWLRLSRLGKFHHISQPLGDYRLHPGQSVQNVKAEKVEEVTLKVLENNTNLENFDLKAYMNLIGEDQDLAHFIQESFSLVVNNAFSLAHLRCAYWYIINGKTKIARKHLSKSLELNPGRNQDYRWWGLKLSSYMRNSFLGEPIQKLLAGFH